MIKFEININRKTHKRLNKEISYRLRIWGIRGVNAMGAGWKDTNFQDGKMTIEVSPAIVRKRSGYRKGSKKGTYYKRTTTIKGRIKPILSTSQP